MLLAYFTIYERDDNPNDEKYENCIALDSGTVYRTH